MKLLLATALVLSLPAQAQVGAVRPGLGERAANAGAADFGRSYRFEIQDRLPLIGPDGRAADADDGLARAAAWGRCVRRAAPDGSLAYIRTAHSRWADPAALHPAFEACRAEAGRFALDHRPAVLRAAIADAWREAAGRR